jgi:hypothetical protein
MYLKLNLPVKEYFILLATFGEAALLDRDLDPLLFGFTELSTRFAESHRGRNGRIEARP